MIGLTGGIASGKSTVAFRLRERGAFVADADEVSREVMESRSVLDEVRASFGDGVFFEDGTLDRRELARLAFSTAEGAAKLNAITHPAIAARLLELARGAEEAGFPLVFADAALLIEAGFHNHCDGVWLVTANEETRLKRIMERDGSSREEAENRIARQLPDSEKIPFASYIIENDGSLEELLEKVDAGFESELFRKLAAAETEFEDEMEAYEEK